MASLLFSLVRSFFINWSFPPGHPVSRTEQPQLFELIDEIAAISTAPKPDKVLLTWEFNACVIQQPRFGWLGGPTNYLIVGLPLMAALTLAEFKALLAHEFAHLRGNHGRFGNWIWRLRAVWEQVLIRWSNEGRRVGRAFGRFVQWYAPYFNAYTFALARENEFEADAWSATVAGAETAARALLKNEFLAQRLEQEFWQRLSDLARTESEPPSGAFGRLLAVLRQPSSFEQRSRWARIVFAAETESLSTHPATMDRLKRLGVPLANALEGPDTIEHAGYASAMQALLGEQRGKDILAELETRWREIVMPWWRARFTESEAMRTRAAQLREMAKTDELNSTDAWELTLLETQLARDPDAVGGLIKDFLSRWPTHALAAFTLGRHLLGADDSGGIEWIERAVELDARDRKSVV